jgi:hypothetical protein
LITLTYWWGFLFLNKYLYKVNQNKGENMAIQVVKQIADNVVVYVNGGTIVDSSTENHFTFQEAVESWGIDSDGWDKSKFTHETLEDDFTFPANFECYGFTIVDGTMAEVTE